MRHATHAPSPIGPLEIPKWISNKFPELTKERLFNAAWSDGFIEPFHFAEVVQTGLYREFEHWRKTGEMK